MKISYLIYAVTLLVLTQACSPFKTLREDQYLLNSQQVKGVDKLSKSEFTLLYRRKTNAQFLGIYPLVSIYNFGAVFYDSTRVQKKIEKARDKYDKRLEENKDTEKKKERIEKQKERKLDKLNNILTNGNLIMRIGEAPAVYDTAVVNQTTRLIAYHLLSEGFFRGTASSEADTSKRKVKVTYHITENTPFMIDSLIYKADDKRIDSIVSANNDEKIIRTQERYNQADLTEERNRLSTLIRDNGYYEFAPSYIYLNVDTSGADPTNIRLQVVISNPEGKEKHPVYTIDSVKVLNNPNHFNRHIKYDTTIYNGIFYKSNPNFRYSKKLTDRKIKIHPGDLFNASAGEKTQRNLSTLNMFQTVGIRYEEDTIQKTVTTRIETNTLRKYGITAEGGLNFSQAFVPGPFLSLSYRERNTFGGFELLDVSLRAAITGQAAVLDPGNVLQTEEYSLTTSLTFPQLFMPGMRALRWENYNPKTKVSAGYGIVRRPEYERATANMNLSYSVHTDPKRQITFSPVDINLINTASISDSFQNYLEYLQAHGNNLIFGFSNSYVSDINASYIYDNHDPMKNNKSRYIKYYLESGGTLFNLWSGDSFLGLNTFRYLKFNTDFRYYFPVKEKSTLAMRLNLGIAGPYGSSSALPYEKYFFAGGPNSIRAWKLRRLGPGSYTQIDSATGEVTYRIERPGELILESSVEYRFKIVGFFEGAFFVDAGNVWMLSADPARPGAQFKPGSFYKQIAVGTGAGIRLNFSFLIVRLDLGIKAYDPALQQFVLTSSGLKQSVINIGLGYPF